MNNELTNMMEVLSRKSSQQGGWEPADATYYTKRLAHWPGSLLRKVADHIEFHVEKWRPDLAQIYSIAAEMESPLPSFSEALAEVEYLAKTHSDFRVEMRNMVNVAVKVENPISYSHPFLVYFLLEVGGMESFRQAIRPIISGYGSYGDGIEKAYERAVQRWRGEVVEQLRLNPVEWDRKYFTAYVRWTRPVLNPQSEHDRARYNSPQELRVATESAKAEHLNRTEEIRWAKLTDSIG